MKTIDVIVPVNTNSDAVRAITELSFATLRASGNDVKFNIVVLEQNKDAEKYAEADYTVNYEFPFNYNRCMNFGAKVTKNDILFLVNNDLVYTKGFYKPILKAFECGLQSLSPTSPSSDAYKPQPLSYGYGINSDLKGWFIAVTRKTLERIDYLDESVSFWYSDNIYADQLRYNHIQHARVTNAFVCHLGSSTLKQSSKEKKNEFTMQQKNIYLEARKKYL